MAHFLAEAEAVGSADEVTPATFSALALVVGGTQVDEGASELVSGALDFDVVSAFLEVVSGCQVVVGVHSVVGAAELVVALEEALT